MVIKNRLNIFLEVNVLLLLSFVFALNIGDKIPSVKALSDQGKIVDIANYSSNKYTLIYFYPKADTAGCTAQAQSLRDQFESLTTAGVEVIGVSTDAVEDQASFKKKHNLPFQLLSDEKQNITKAFSVPVTLGFASRQAYLFKHGSLVWFDHTASTAEQADDVLRYLRSQSTK